MRARTRAAPTRPARPNSKPDEPPDPPEVSHENDCSPGEAPLVVMPPEVPLMPLLLVAPELVTPELDPPELAKPELEPMPPQLHVEGSKGGQAGALTDWVT
jgi:hypothetical protein